MRKVYFPRRFFGMLSLAFILISVLIILCRMSYSQRSIHIDHLKYSPEGKLQEIISTDSFYHQLN
jgi:hypothetical protein